MKTEVKYQVWVRSRGWNPYGVNITKPCENAIYDTREEAEKACEPTGTFVDAYNTYFIREIQTSIQST